jgi:predicted N-acetyltransferase YhbS
VDIRFLADHPGHVDTLADWHHAEWGHLYDDWSREAAAAELQDHALRRDRPTTMVALDDDGALLGSVSLVDEDAPELADRGDAWLASLYVLPAHRGRGLGAALVRALVVHAAALRIERLWLFTPAQAPFYARLGWQAAGSATLRGTPVSVMTIAPAVIAPAPPPSADPAVAAPFPATTLAAAAEETDAS